MSKSGPRNPQNGGMIYRSQYVSPDERTEILRYLSGLYPIWENRYSAHNPPPVGQKQRALLRPVYWLGNWQFACLNYYHPPKGILHRCVKAEPYPPVLAKLVKKMEDLVRREIRADDIPKSWHLNTCLINFYGHRMQDGKKIDSARVGEHKDFEPGPVTSLSFGERALIQFVESRHREARSQVVLQQWLEDSSLQIFAGERWKSRTFHRVQRVEDKLKAKFDVRPAEFHTRRLNFTFRYVPDEHILPLMKLPAPLQSDVHGYVEELAQHSEYWAKQLTLPIRSER